MKSRGFTLVELLVVIAIIGLLTTIAVTATGAARAKARDVRRLTDVRQIAQALYLAENDGVAFPYTPPSSPFCIGLGTAAKCWGERYHGDNALMTTLSTYFSDYTKIPSDPSWSGRKGDKYLYMGSTEIVARHCDGGDYVNGPLIVWVPDSDAPASDAECGNSGFWGCCGDIDCAFVYYCAYPL